MMKKLCIMTLIFFISLSYTFSIKYKAEDIFTDEATIELAKAAERGNIKKIDEALSNGADINAVSNEGVFTPLLWTYFKPNKKGFEYLLKKGADPNYMDKKGHSVMYYAAIDKDPYYLKTALEYGGNPDLLTPGELNETLIFRAIIHYKIENIKLLINAGANLNQQDIAAKDTPMMYASVFNGYDIIYILLKSGADPLLENSSGKTLIDRIEEKNINTHHPIYKWYKKVVDLLRARGIEVNVEL